MDARITKVQEAVASESTTLSLRQEILYLLTTKSRKGKRKESRPTKVLLSMFVEKGQTKCLLYVNVRWYRRERVFPLFSFQIKLK